MLQNLINLPLICEFVELASQQLGMALGNILALFNSGLLNSAAVALSAVAHSQHVSALRVYLVWSLDIHCRCAGHAVLPTPEEQDTSVPHESRWLQLVWERSVFWVLVPKRYAS